MINRAWRSGVQPLRMDCGACEREKEDVRRCHWPAAHNEASGAHFHQGDPQAPFEPGAG